jgi:glycosyltransferase involved in cell wall biosynthesis
MNDILTIQITNQDTVIGGAYDRYMILINAFLNRGCTVHHLSPHGFSNIKHPKLSHHGVKESPFPPKFVLFFLQSIIKMFQITFNYKIDVIVAFSPLEALLGIFYKLFSRKTKLVVSFRCDSVASCLIMEDSIKRKILIYFINLIDKIAIKNSDLVIFISKKNKADILKRTKIKSSPKIKIIYNGITPRLKELSKERKVRFSDDEKLSDDEKIIGYVGLLFQGKGVRYLIESFSQLINKIPNLKLVIVGDGPDKEKLLNLTNNLGIEDKIIFTGYKKNPIKYIKGFDLLVVPSLVEPFGIVILEAFYVGTPVIGSCVGGITEILKYHELLFKPGNQHDLESKLYKILTDEESYQKLLKLCQERSQSFNQDWVTNMVNTICELIDQ